MTYSDEDLRALRDHVFGPRPTESDEPDDTDEPSLLVKAEGQNPATKLSDEQINAHFIRSLIDEQFDRLNPPLPEEGTP